MQSDVFWKMLMPTIIILMVGIWIGIAIDSGRVNELKERLTESEILFNDIRLYTDFFELFDVKQNISDAICKAAFDANLAYNDRIYSEGIMLEKYEAANKFSQDFIVERKKYAIQQLQFWTNALRIKKLCNADYDVVLHLWKYDTKNDSSIDVPQALQSAALLDLKDSCGSSLMLSNSPIDLNLTSVYMIVKAYNITKTPALIINDNVVLEGFKNLEELKEYVRC